MYFKRIRVQFFVNFAFANVSERAWAEVYVYYNEKIPRNA